MIVQERSLVGIELEDGCRRFVPDGRGALVRCGDSVGTTSPVPLCAEHGREWAGWEREENERLRVAKILKDRKLEEQRQVARAYGDRHDR